MDDRVTQTDETKVHVFSGTVDPDGLPERFLRVRGIEVHGDQTHAVVETGLWLSWDGGPGSVGSLGVLFDNVLAYPMLNGAPARSTLVSTEITIDAMAPVPVDGQRLTVRGRLVHRDVDTAFATAELCTGAGLTVAVASQRGRFIPLAEAASYDYRQLAAGRGAGLADLIWADDAPPHLDADGRVELVVSSRLGNHMDNLHGGLSLLLAEWSGIAAVRARGSDLSSRSVRISYARPIPVGTTVRFETTVLHLGRSTATVMVVARTHTGRCGVAATVTLG